MPDSVELIERSVREKRHGVVISGYYGFGNLGDELILDAMVSTLCSEGLRVTVLSANPPATEARLKAHGEVRAIGRTDIIAILNALRHARMLVSGGGGLFQDASGPLSPVYYGGIIAMARFHAGSCRVLGARGRAIDRPSCPFYHPMGTQRLPGCVGPR